MKVYRRAQATVEAHRIPQGDETAPMDLDQATINFCSDHHLQLTVKPNGQISVRRMFAGGDNPTYYGYQGWWIVLDDGVRFIDHDTFKQLYSFVPAAEVAA